MSVIQQLITTEDDGSISFGNHLLTEKKKISDFEVSGDLFKIKTFYEITRLERNGMLLYESVPGTTVHNFIQQGNDVNFNVESDKGSNITLELEPDKYYKIYVDQMQVDKVKSNLSGKITFSIDLKNTKKAIKIEQV